MSDQTLVADTPHAKLVSMERYGMIIVAMSDGTRVAVRCPICGKQDMARMFNANELRQSGDWHMATDHGIHSGVGYPFDD